jgi:hypothetical protein
VGSVIRLASSQQIKENSKVGVVLMARCIRVDQMLTYQTSPFVRIIYLILCIDIITELSVCHRAWEKGKKVGEDWFLSFFIYLSSLNKLQINRSK